MSLSTQWNDFVNNWSDKYYQTLFDSGIKQSDLDYYNNHSWFQSHGFDLSKFRTTNLEVLVAWELFYLISTGILVFFKWIREPAKGAPKKPVVKEGRFSAMKLVIFFHNLSLSIFSGFVFFYNAPLVYRLFKEKGFGGAVCGGFSEIYDGSYGWWNYLFYLSKFYEFLDTYVVLFRGRYPMVLQFYHHLGAPIGMWMVLTTKCTAGYLFVVENSFIHTVMYFYYACSTLKIPIPGKKMITIMQIVQFIIGTTTGLLQIAMYGDCMSWGDKATIWYHEIFAGSLIILFVRFYKRAYKKPHKKGVGPKEPIVYDATMMKKPAVPLDNKKNQ